MAHIELQNITKLFPVRVNGTVQVTRALEGVTFAVERGEIVCLVGPSGCGKTTALRIMMGLDSATSGNVLVNGKAVTGCGYDRGMVFQHAELLPWCSALENIEFGLQMKGVPEPERNRTAKRYLDLVGLGHAGGQRPRQLSGGMKQRVGLARALAIDPEILLMDEPFGALDSQTQETLQAQTLDIHRKTGKTIVFVTHDLDEAIFLADRIVVMTMGRVERIVTVKLDPARREVREVRGEPEYVRTRSAIWEILHASGGAAKIGAAMERTP